MGNCNYYYRTWRFACSSSSSSVKLLFFVVPLILVSLFVPKFSGGGSIISDNHSWVAGNSTEVSGSDGGVGESMGIDFDRKVGGGAVDIQPELVVMAAAEAENKVVGVEDQSPNSSPTVINVHVIDDVQEPVINATEDAITTSNNGSIDLSVSAKLEKKVYTNLERVEAGLQNARVAIKEARIGNQTNDSEYFPMGPMYWNAKVFHRSYLEMEKQLKVFVYEEGEPPVFHNGPCKSIYSMEGNFIHRMEIDGQFRTKDPEKAHVFFLPFSVAMMVQFVYVRNSHDFGPIRRTVSDYVNLISEKYPYWNRSLGADHFMLACHDWGPETSFSNPHLGKNAIRALCNANTSERFNPIKDVSFPEINLQTGGLHGPIRPILLQHWEGKDDDMKVHRYLPKGVSYYDMMRKTKFCLCPSGYEVASPRVVEAFYTGCVPVLISDHYVPPFSDVLNWKSFSVEVPVSEIPNLKRILESISSTQYIRMQRRVVQIRRHFEVNSPPKRYDVYHMILHSIWLRRLNVKIHDDQQLSINN
ncbi:Exostosin family protein [Euphorbia peplus]|nr:Exostosin family protein [Euphorbia peplus]